MSSRPLRNRAVASRPYGRFAEGGGVNITSTPFFLRPRRGISTLTIDASRITANAVTLTDAFASDVEAHATTGGILIAGDDDCTKPTSGCVRGTIRKSFGMDHGGGIWNGSLDPSSPLGPLRLINSTVARNVLNASAGITAQGGGIFTIAKPSIRHTTIAHNQPDQCHGC